MMPPSGTRQLAPTITETAGRGGRLSLSLLERIGWLSTLGFLFVLYTRLGERYLPQLHLPMVFGAMMVFCSLASRNLLEVLQKRVTIFLVLFTFWFVVCIPFSTWRGGSFSVLTDRWLKSMLLFMAISCLLPTFQYVRRIVMWDVMSVGITAFLALFLFGHRDDSGRLGLFQTGELSNANQFALIMLLALPLAWFWLSNSRLNLFQRVPALVLTGFIVAALLQTGSRSSLLALAVMVTVVFFQQSLSNKIKLIVVLLFLAPVIVAIMPRSILLRLSTFTSANVELSEEEMGIQRSTVESARSRMQLQREALVMTLKHPLFGVGPGTFIVNRAHEKEKEGKKGGQNWIQPHNTFTQISSEMGIPGAGFFLGAVVACFLSMRRLLRQTRLATSSPAVREVRLMAQCLVVQLTGLCLMFLFSTNAYDYYFVATAGQIVAAEITAAPLLARAKDQAKKGEARPPFQPLPNLPPKGSLLRRHA